MRCPYCEGKMRKGQLHAVGAGAGLEWKEGSESLRLNTDPELAARISGDRIASYFFILPKSHRLSICKMRKV